MSRSKLRRAIKTIRGVAATVIPEFQAVAEQELGDELRRRVLRMTELRAGRLREEWDKLHPSQPIDVESEDFERLVGEIGLSNQLMFQEAAKQLATELRAKQHGKQLADMIESIVNRSLAEHATRIQAQKEAR